MLIREAQKAKKSGKGCWTCKRRKIGCDQGLPTCVNCSRTGRDCEGYGMKLNWPEAGDGRRASYKWGNGTNNHKMVKFKGQVEGLAHHFLNTTFDDVYVLSEGTLSSLVQQVKALPRPSRGLGIGYELGLEENHVGLLSYYTEVLSRMITTIDDSQNGFRIVLLPTALSKQSISSRSLWFSIMAVSAAHLYGSDAATHYKLSAIRFLSKSFQDGEHGTIGQFATCMMLCVCDVFDSADGSWYIHLDAASRMLSRTKEMAGSGQPISFLQSWMAYHSVLADFSHGPGNSLYTITPILPSEAEENITIVGSLGCSMQVLECISCINKLVKITEHTTYQNVPAEGLVFIEQLLNQLETLKQIPRIAEDGTSGQIDRLKVVATADLYRLAALIYLHRSILFTPQASPIIQNLVSQSLSMLTKLKVCTSPWPLFLTALEVLGDEQRVMILNIIEKMQTERRIANVEIIRSVIEGVWKKADLIGGTERVNWKTMIGDGQCMPSFI